MSNMASNWDALKMLEFFGPKLLVAMFCGGLVGLERELKNKPAGIKTNMLICIGSALVTAASAVIAGGSGGERIGDPGRLAAQIVSGIGFLGGGVILKSQGAIIGMTTAATIWVVAALGICVGIERYDIAILTSLMVVLMLRAISFFEEKILGRSQAFGVEVVAQDASGLVRRSLNYSLEANDLHLDDFDVDHQGEMATFRIRYRGNRASQKQFLLDVWALPGIKEVKRI